jgi:uncharacterized RDD family membrane protein YckC
MQLYIANKDGKQTGPFSEEQVQSMLSGGFVAMNDLCWHEGLPAWVPLTQVLVSATHGPPPVPAVSHLRSPWLSHSGQHPGFWLRFAAHFIDTIIVYVAAFAAGLMVGVVMASSGTTDEDILAVLGAIAGTLGAIAGTVAGWLYYALMESSPKQATLGKMACGFIVTNLDGQRISFWQATGRYFGMIVSALILCIGFLMCAWTERKQCLHDMMAGCLMFKK